jgi:IS30 family transposase
LLGFQGLTPYQNQIHTITYDNGLEFSEHQNIAQTLSANIYLLILILPGNEV